LSSKGHICFASDFHLGIPGRGQSLEREKWIVRWLEEVSTDAEEIFLLGDIFDFWFEFRHVIPKGFARLQGKLAELTDRGIPVHLFTGNHDMWMFGYLSDELGLQIHKEPLAFERKGYKLLIGHGDGLGPGDRSYKMLKKLFANKLAQRAFAFMHPWYGMGIAQYWSRKSRLSEGGRIPPYMGEEKERLVQYCRSVLEKEHFDFFIFGHRHLPLDIKLNEKSRYINTGDWIHHRSYAVLDSAGLQLREFA